MTMNLYVHSVADMLIELKSKCFQACCLSTYDFSSLLYILHCLIIKSCKDKQTELIKQTFYREGSLDSADLSLLCVLFPCVLSLSHIAPRVRCVT